MPSTRIGPPPPPPPPRAPKPSAPSAFENTYEEPYPYRVTVKTLAPVPSKKSGTAEATETAPAETRAPKGSGLRFKLFGIPISVNLSFMLVGLVVGYGPRIPVSLLLTFEAVIAASVLWHELGHAVAFKLFGHEPEIKLLGIWGLTWSRTKRELTPGESAVVSAAGPLFGLVLAGFCYAFDSPAPRFGPPSTMHLFFLVNLIISLANLLPAFPLDGGRIVKALLEILAPKWSDKLVHAISVLAATGAMWFAMTHDLTLWALMLLGIVSMNFKALRGGNSVQSICGA